MYEALENLAFENYFLLTGTYYERKIVLDDVRKIE